MINEIRITLSKIKKILEENTDWEYKDPLEIEPEDMNEISLFNLKSLFANLVARQIYSKYLTFTVFLAWISKELREDAFKEVFTLVFVFAEKYYHDIIDNPKFKED